MKRYKLLLIALLFWGCSSSIFSVISGIFISPRVYSNYSECSPYINRYNDLQDEKSKLATEYEERNKENILSEKEKIDYENRILDLTFQIDNSLQKWQDCKSRHSN